MFLELKHPNGSPLLTINLERVLMVTPAPGPIKSGPEENAPAVPGSAIHFASGAIMVPVAYEIVADAIQDACALELEDVTPAGRA